MPRLAVYLSSPEALLAVLNLGVLIFCARHRSYSDEDVHALGLLAYALPLLAGLAGFAQLAFPFPKTWLWLTRANVETWATLFYCGFRIVDGFGAPGSGPKGQDAGFIIIVAFGLCVTAVANAFALAQILRATRPSLENWLQAHPVGGFLAICGTAVPVMIVQLVVFGLAAGLFGFFHTLFLRL